MSVLELTDAQVIALVRQLPPSAKRTALFELAQEAQAGRDERLAFGESQLRKTAANQGRDWDSLSEDERKDLVNNLPHER